MKSHFALPIIITACFALSATLPIMAENNKDSDCKSGAKQCHPGDKACHAQVSKCIRKCELAVKHLEKKKSDPKLISTIKDCIAACKAHDKHQGSAKDCADKCNACATACEQANDPDLKACIEECKSCAGCCTNEKG